MSFRLSTLRVQTVHSPLFILVCSGERNLRRVSKLLRGALVGVFLRPTLPFHAIVQTLSPGYPRRDKSRWRGGISIEAHESRKSHGKLGECQQSTLCFELVLSVRHRSVVLLFLSLNIMSVATKKAPVCRKAR